jgi:hypothetical protein
MEPSHRTRFVETAGHVIIDSLHLPSFGTGLVLSIPIFLAFFFAVKVQSGTLTLVSVIALFPLTLYALCRHALNGLAGDSVGGLFAKTGGTIEDLVPVFTRFFALTLVWAAPAIVMIGLYEPKLRGSFGAPFRMAPAEPPPVLLTLYLGTGFFAGFLLLSVSVAAATFTDAFSLEFWAGMFRGRTGEIFLMMAASIGTPAAVFIVASPWLAALAQKNSGLSGFLTGGLLIYLFGILISLQGRLCGFFAAAVMGNETAQSVPVISAASAEPQPAATSSEAAPEPPGIPSRDEEIRQAWVLFGQDRRAATERLEGLVQQYGPDGRVLHALATMYLQSGDSTRAADSARKGLPLCSASGEGKLARDLYVSFASQVAGWGYGAAQYAQIGDALLQAGDAVSAANVFAFGMHADPNDAKAFKGLLKVAGKLSHKGESPDRAMKIYEFLLSRAPGSPFADHARIELDILRKKLTKS